jgi:hypothetical protein
VAGHILQARPVWIYTQSNISARVSCAFLNSCNIPACSDQAIQTRKP